VWDALVELWLRLVCDPINCVREPAAEAAGAFLVQLTPDWNHPSDRAVKTLAGILEYIGTSLKSTDRQAFVRIACSVATSRSVPVSVFSVLFGPRLLELSRDGSATVRTTWAREVCPLLRSPGGRLASHKELVLAAHGRLTDEDGEVAKLAKRVAYAPMDELVDSCPPSPGLDSQAWVSSFKMFLSEANAGSESLAQFVLGGVNADLLGS
jgi:hypothetical protein